MEKLLNQLLSFHSLSRLSGRFNLVYNISGDSPCVRRVELASNRHVRPSVRRRHTIATRGLSYVPTGRCKKIVNLFLEGSTIDRGLRTTGV